MDGPPTKDGTQQLEELIHAVEDLRRRVAALERQTEPAAIYEPSAPAEQLPPSDFSPGLLAGLGRLLLGIAGAYLLRAITEAGILPHPAGALVGLVYACGWLLSSIRIFSANRLIVALQALTAALIAGPLLWEATVRFHSLSPAGAAAALALFMVLGNLVAWRGDLSVIAGVIAMGGSVTAIALIAGTLNPVPFVIGLCAAAAVVEVGACRDRALSVRWITALAANLCAILLLYLTTRPQGLPEGYAPVPIPAVIAIELALAAIYVASTVTRTLILRLPIAWFEIAQVAAVLALAIGTGLRLGGNVAIGASCLVAGAVCYLIAFTGRRPNRNFHAYATFALLLTTIGITLVFSGFAPEVVWSLLGLIGTWLGARWKANTLRFHGAVYLIGTAASSGLLTYLPPPSSAVLCAIVTALAYGAIVRLRNRRVSSTAERVAAAISVALLCWSIVALAGGFESTLSTVVISTIAIALAWFGRHWNLPELIWVLYPWMVFGAAKLLAEDFRHSRPAALALSLLVYGGALIALPRLLRRARPPRADLS